MVPDHSLGQGTGVCSATARQCQMLLSVKANVECNNDSGERGGKELSKRKVMEIRDLMQERKNVCL